MEEKGGKEIWKEFALCLYFGVQKESWLLSEVLSLSFLRSYAWEEA